MAQSFGGHPTLMRFIEFAKEAGCTAKAYTRVSKGGRSVHVLRIEASTGAYVLVTNPDYLERLTPSNVTYLQRRLGIKTPFSSEPE